MLVIVVTIHYGLCQTILPVFILLLLFILLPTIHPSIDPTNSTTLSVCLLTIIQLMILNILYQLNVQLLLDAILTTFVYFSLDGLFYEKSIHYEDLIYFQEHQYQSQLDHIFTMYSCISLMTPCLSNEQGYCYISISSPIIS